MGTQQVAATQACHPGLPEFGDPHSVCGDTWTQGAAHLHAVPCVFSTPSPSPTSGSPGESSNSSHRLMSSVVVGCGSRPPRAKVGSEGRGMKSGHPDLSLVNQDLTVLAAEAGAVSPHCVTWP